MIRLQEDFGRSPLAHPLDNILIFNVRSVDVKNQKVWVKWIKIRFRSLHQELTGKSAHRAILDDQIGVGKLCFEIIRYFLRPFLLGNRLAVKQDSDGVSMLRSAAR